MLKKYTVEYSIQFRKHSPPEHHQYFTDDPVACEEFVQGLLERGMGLHAIRHDGSDLSRPDFDRIVKVGARRLVFLRRVPGVFALGRLFRRRRVWWS